MWLEEVNRFPEIEQLLSAQRFGHLIHKAKSSSPRGTTSTSAQMKQLNHSSKWSKARKELLHSPFPQNCILTITTVFTTDDIPDCNSCFRASFYQYYGEFLFKKAPCLSRPPLFPHSKAISQLEGGVQPWLKRAFQSFIECFTESNLSLLLTNQSMGRLAAVGGGGWGKSGKGDQKGDSSSSWLLLISPRSAHSPYQGKSSHKWQLWTTNRHTPWRENTYVDKVICFTK